MLTTFVWDSGFGYAIKVVGIKSVTAVIRKQSKLISRLEYVLNGLTLLAIVKILEEKCLKYIYVMK